MRNFEEERGWKYDYLVWVSQVVTVEKEMSRWGWGRADLAERCVFAFNAGRGLAIHAAAIDFLSRVCPL